MDKTEEELRDKILKGANYFYSMKPSEFSNHFVTEWNHLMKFCKMIMKHEEKRIENLVNDTLMRAPIEQQALPETEDLKDK